MSLESLTIGLIESNWSQDHALVVADFLEEQEGQKRLADCLRKTHNHLLPSEMDEISTPYSHHYCGFCGVRRPKKKASRDAWHYRKKKEKILTYNYFCIVETLILKNGEVIKDINKQLAIAMLCSWVGYHNKGFVNANYLNLLTLSDFLILAEEKALPVPKREIKEILQRNPLGVPFGARLDYLLRLHHV